MSTRGVAYSTQSLEATDRNDDRRQYPRARPQDVAIGDFLTAELADDVWWGGWVTNRTPAAVVIRLLFAGPFGAMTHWVLSADRDRPTGVIPWDAIVRMGVRS